MNPSSKSSFDDTWEEVYGLKAWVVQRRGMLAELGINNAGEYWERRSGTKRQPLEESSWEPVKSAKVLIDMAIEHSNK